MFNPFNRGSSGGGGGGGTTNYSQLINKPQINGITLNGNLTTQDLLITAQAIGAARILQDTTANWNAKRSLVSENQCIYVYTDYREVDGEYIPAFKFGDGNAYLIDLPFVNNITINEIQSWNNKVSAKISDHDAETLELY